MTTLAARLLSSTNPTTLQQVSPEQAVGVLANVVVNTMEDYPLFKLTGAQMNATFVKQLELKDPDEEEATFFDLNFGENVKPEQVFTICESLQVLDRVKGGPREIITAFSDQINNKQKEFLTQLVSIEPQFRLFKQEFRTIQRSETFAIKISG